jgi:hypothetical protein
MPGRVGLIERWRYNKLCSADAKAHGLRLACADSIVHTISPHH